jgi:eukaryotic-like serine/threonine-protein kinase
MHDPRNQPTEAFGPYLIYEQLGSGGMATVHRAKKQGIEGVERPVALKRLLPELQVNDEFVRAFVREARLAAQLRHTNIAQTYDLGRVEGHYYIAMELVPGHDLRAVLRHTAYATGPMPVPLVLAVLLQLCDALDYAHTFKDENGTPLGLVHRDVSPANVLVADDGTVKLVDFGIAKATAGNWQTMSGQLKGKFSYMAPEMLDGIVDARADLFSLGVCAYELLTAQPLFGTAGDDLETLKRVKAYEPPPPSQINRHVPRDVDLLVQNALAKNPTQRWQTAGQLRGALGALTRTPGLAASQQDLAAWLQWAFAQPAGARRWDEPAFGAAAPVGAADDPSIVIEHAAVPVAPAPMAPPGPMSGGYVATMPLPAAQVPPASPAQLQASAARTMFVDGGGQAQPAPRPRPASDARTLFVDGGGAPAPIPSTAAWPPAPPRAGDAASRPTVVPGYGPSAQTMPAPRPEATPGPAPRARRASNGLPPTGAQISSPEYLQAMAAYNSGAVPPMNAPEKERARALVDLPPPPRSSGLGVLLFLLLCAAAAVGGYFVVHYVTTR